MTAALAPAAGSGVLWRQVVRARGLWIAVAAFCTIILVLQGITPGSLTYFDFSYLSSGGAALALAGIGQTLVVLTGGFDLSCAATISLVNAVLATHMGESVGSQAFWALAGIGIGCLVGAVNGFFVAYMRLQPVVVTLATMFILRGLALLVLPKPGGRIGADLSAFLTYDAIPELLPAPVVMLLVALAIWRLIRRSRFGTGIYAVGSDREAAFANGIKVSRVLFWAYVIAGAYYGAAGVFLGAVTGSGDALVGAPMLMPIFAAVVLGGTALGGGRGGPVGTVFGAYTLMLTVNVLLVLNVSAYYATVAEALVIILAVVGASISRDSPLGGQVRSLHLKWRAWRAGMSPKTAGVLLPRISLVSREHELRPNDELSGSPLHRWFQRNRELVGQLTPSFVLAILAVAATFIMFGTSAININYVNSLLVLTSFLAILGLGQGAVILAGGFDLSVPWTITFCAMLMANVSGGTDAGLIVAVPLALGVGVLIGAFNGIGVVAFGLPAIIMTLATDGLIHGLALVYTQGGPTMSGAPGLKWFLGGKILGFSPTVWLLGVFVVAATLLLSRTPFGRRIYAVGCSTRVARMSGVSVARTQLGVFMLSGFCSALVGVLLVGFGSQAVLGMGNTYMLPAIAVVVVGGTLVTGGRGHYLGTFGGALLLTSVGILLAGTTWPEAVREILIGLVVMVAIITLREKHGG